MELVLARCHFPYIGYTRRMTDEIPVGDVTFVSSKRASEISGYAQDYIGQLARTGQIQAKRVGGLWYVLMESLESYRTQPEVPQTVQGEDRSSHDDTDVLVSFDGKDYISANRASKITGYNQDYIGQLARSGKVLARQVGNRWYVDRDGLINHKTEKDALLAAVQVAAVGIRHTDTVDPVEPEEVENNTSASELLNYIPDEGDLTPVIEKPEHGQENAPRGDWNENIVHPGHVVDLKNRVYGDSIKAGADIPSRDPGFSPIQLQYTRPVVRSGKIKMPQFKPWVIVSVVTVMIAVGLLSYAHLVGADRQLLGGSKNIPSEFANGAVNTLQNIMNGVEHMISPELIYQRSK